MMRVIKVEKNGCMPCKKLDKILSELGIDIENAIEHYNIDEREDYGFVEEYDITSTPTLVKIKADGSYEKLIGIVHTKQEFKDFLELENTNISNPVTVNCCENGCCSL